MRDVIQVERLPEPASGIDDPPRPAADTPEDPSIDAGSLAAIGRVADEVLPSIVARLAVSGLGEIEVRHADWHVRVRRSLGMPEDPPVAGAVHREAPTIADDGTPAAPAASPHAIDVATSPAVGYFVPRPGLVVGTRVRAGDGLGSIDVLGVRQEVVAPGDGLVGKLFVEAGDPVEYGQELVQLVPGGAHPSAPGPDGTEA